MPVGDLMIVSCTGCQAKFRIADEKVGPRGAKVRCSRCQNVFLAHRELGSVPLGDAKTPAPRPPLRDAAPANPAGQGRASISPAPARAAPRPTPPPARPARAAAAPTPAHTDPFLAPAPADPFAVPRSGSLAPPPLPASRAPSSAPAFDPFGVDTPGSYVAPVDPFAPAAAADPFAPVAPPAGDPFAGSAADPGLLPDPFARAGAPGDPSGEAADPFDRAGAAATGDPFAADSDPFSTGPGFELDDPPRSPATTAAPFPANGAQTGAARLPVTDLSHLLGESGAGPAHPAPAAPASAGSAPGELDFSGDLALGPGGADLALEDRSTPAPTPLAPSDGALVMADGFPGDPFSDPGVPSAFAASGGDVPLELATEGAGPQRSAAVPLEAQAAGIPAARTGTGTVPSRPLGSGGADAATPAAPAAVDVAERAPERRAAPLRALAVNAIALAALLAVALAIRVVWRGDASLGAGGLRPSSLVGALGDASGEPATFAPVALTNGLYERVSGPPLLFVRGEVLSRAPGPVDGIDVAVELVRDGVVVARGAGRAGAIPTAEELHLAAGPAAVAALEAAVRSRAPAEIRPGDRVPFLVAVDGLPADLEGAGLRVVTGPAGAGARR